MPNLGAILGNTYQIPQAQAAPQQAPAKPQFQDEIGPALEGLKQVDGVTEEYFNKWAQLKGFAKDVWENYGIDVRYQDPSVPESNRLHRIYLKSIADLKAQGNRLKTGQKMYEADRTIGNKVENPNQGYYDEKSTFNPEKIGKVASEHNAIVQRRFETKAAAEQAQKYSDGVKADLMQMKKDHPEMARQIDLDIAALKPVIYDPEVFAPQRESQADKNKADAYKAANTTLQHIDSLVTGAAKTYKLSDDKFSPEGGRLEITYDTKGQTYGGDPIERWEHEPETGNSYIVTRGKDNLLRRTRATDVLSISQQLSSKNTRLGPNGEELINYAKDNGLISSETGEYIPGSSLKDVDFEALAAQKAKAIEKSTAGLQRKSVENKITSLEPSAIFSGRFRDGRETFIDKEGIPIKVVVRDVNGGKIYEIENASAVLKPKKGEKLSDIKMKSKDALVRFLTSRGVHLGETIGGAPKTIDTSNMTPAQILEAHRAKNK